MVLPLYLFTFLPLSMLAQDDDMYFVPTKENLAKEAKMYGMPQNVYYSGSNRSVDDYNRRAQFSYPVDSTGNDIIDFSAVRGVYPDSAYSQPVENDDYALTRRMSRFDDYTPSEAYWDGYRAGHGGTGTIRSTTALGMAGAIRTIIPHGIRPVTTVIAIMVAATSAVVEADA